MPNLFGNAIMEEHPLFGLLVLAERSDKQDERVLARNLADDRRVGQKREESFVDFAKRAKDVCRVGDLLGEYHKVRIRNSRLPEFADPNVNLENIVWSRGGDILTGIRPLLRFVNISRLNAVFHWGAERPRRMKDFFPGGFPKIDFFAADAFGRALDERLGKGDAGQREAFVAGLCQLLNMHYEQKAPFEPTWATDMEEFRRLGMGNHGIGADLPELLGVPVRAGEWYAAFAYETRTFDRLMRPTQLDAGRFPEHYPSPPAWTFEGLPAGTAMNLNRPLRCCRRVPGPEFVHTFSPLGLAHWIAAGSVLRKANASSEAGLDQPRYCHDKALRGGLDCDRRTDCAGWECERCAP